MSGIGFWELIILFLIGLIVLGPERLPRVANQLGTWLGQARRMTRVMRRQLEEEIDIERELRIKPDPDKDKPTYTRPDYVSRNDKDDTYSPAHGPESAGTGVGDNVDESREHDETVAMASMEDGEVGADPFAETAVMPPRGGDEAAGATEPADSAKEKTA